MPTLFGKEVSDHTYELNKHMLNPPKEPKTAARKDLETEMRQRFARQFEATWALCGGPELEKEFKFCPERGWRSDYRCGQWLIELEGGVFLKSGGGHRSKSGYIEDVFKYNEASLMGYRLIRIATGMATPHYLSQIIAKLNS